MIGREDIQTWQDFKILDTQEQVSIINELLNNGHTVPQIMESLGADRSTLGSHFKKLGYKRIGNEYKAIEGEIEAPRATAEAKPKEKKQDRKKTLEIISDVYNSLEAIGDDEYIRTSISLAKSVNDELDVFVKQLRVINKQDLVSVALKEFMDKYK